MKILCAQCLAIIPPEKGQGGGTIYGICQDCALPDSPLPAASPRPPVPPSLRPRGPTPPPGGWLLFMWALLLAACAGFWWLVFLALSHLWDWAVGP